MIDALKWRTWTLETHSELALRRSPGDYFTAVSEFLTSDF
jgi:hypothetical protein